MQSVLLPTPRRSGFTLFEVMVLVTILGLMAAVAIPSVATLKETRLKAGVLEFDRLLNVLRTRAMLEGRPHAMYLVQDNSKVNIKLMSLDPDFPDTLGWSPVYTASGEQFASYDMNIAYGVSISEMEADGASGTSLLISFDPNGSLQYRDDSTGALVTTKGVNGAVENVIIVWKNVGAAETVIDGATGTVRSAFK